MGLTPRKTGRLIVGRNVNLTLALIEFRVAVVRSDKLVAEGIQKPRGS
jgi:hypothetical protein